MKAFSIYTCHVNREGAVVEVPPKTVFEVDQAQYNEFVALGAARKPTQAELDASDATGVGGLAKRKEIAPPTKLDEKKLDARTEEFDGAAPSISKAAQTSSAPTKSAS